MSQLIGNDDLIVVTGVGGCIGGHLVAQLSGYGWGKLLSDEA